MTYTVSSGTLNSSIPYHTIPCSDTVGWVTGRASVTASGLLKAGCWFVGGDNSTGALHVLQLGQLQLSPLTTSVILSSTKIQNGDVLVPANPGPRKKMAVKQLSSLSTPSSAAAVKLRMVGKQA